MGCVLVNFGGPRSLEEIRPFLEELLTDPDVIRTRLPLVLQRWLFRRVARKRSGVVRHDYERIGGRSPIYFDTEVLADRVAQDLGKRVVTFHRYLPATHAESLEKIEAMEERVIQIVPLFPQFSYSTTGSIARFFAKNLSKSTVQKLRWVKSYPAHPLYVAAFQAKIRGVLEKEGFAEEETCLIFSAHGVPVSFIETGDVYQSECELSFQAILGGFPKALGLLAYQSKFGRGEWLRPYTNEVCEELEKWCAGRKKIVFVPLSFTTDHLETLFEIEDLYVGRAKEKGFHAVRCPALNLDSAWSKALVALFRETNLCSNSMLLSSCRLS